jgi:hypothetical protein
LPIEKPSLDPPKNPTERPEIASPAFSARHQPRSTITVGPSLPRQKSVLGTENCTFGHRSTTQNRTSPLAPLERRPLSIGSSLSSSLSLSLSISLSVSLSLPISPSQTHSHPLPHHVPVKGKKKNRRRKNEEKKRNKRFFFFTTTC